MITEIITYTFEYLLVIAFVRFYITYPLGKYMVPNNPKYSAQEYISRVRKCGSSILNVVFYASLTYKIYKIIKNEPIFPSYLGGSGSLQDAILRDELTSIDYNAIQLSIPSFIMNNSIEYSIKTLNDSLMSFYYIQFAFHIAETIMHLVSPRRSDFMEMMIHHVATLSLVLYSMMYNRTNVGVLIMFLHDISDIPVYLCKTFSDTKFTGTTVVSFVLLISGWIYFRIYALGMIIYELLLNSEGFHFGMTCVLIVLYALHYYWLFLMFKIAYNMIFNKKMEDIQEQHISDE